MGDHTVLDKGFVDLVEYMGGDRGVIQAARVCYRSNGLSDQEKDKKLVNYLMSNDHLSPFEHSVFKFHVKAPLFVARQWFRHRSSSYNETSQRYAVVQNEFYFPEKWRAQDNKNKQGSIESNLDHTLENTALKQTTLLGMANYQRAIERGVAKEMARFHLPVNVYTEWYWTVNSRNLMAFIKLRSDSHAQWEIRQYSNALWPLFAKTMPWTAEAFLGTLNLTRYQATDGLPGPNISDIPEVAHV